jgi:hypothetical protein
MGNMMQGQWLGKFDSNGLAGSIRVELEIRGDAYFGHAYVFYNESLSIPGLRFRLHVPRNPPHIVDVDTWYLYPGGGVMSSVDRHHAEKFVRDKFGIPIPENFQITFACEGIQLRVDWRSPEGASGSELLSMSDAERLSELTGRPDLQTWDQFRQWAVDKKPRQYIFRGQRNPNRLASSFHRTWRSDLASWIEHDVRSLFGAIVEKVNYPLQLGQLDHNSAIWSLLQHHGYPTPLLDWTYSPFVAAYFAFEGAIDPAQSSPRIYIFDQTAWINKYGRTQFIVDAAPPQLMPLESIAIGNPRAGPQQALSTVTNVADIESFVREKEQEDDVSYLTVCDLPATDRPRIMRELELMGITYGSLFPGIDGICRDMKDRMFKEPTE